MKLLALLSLLSLAAPAPGQVLDQSSASSNAWFHCFEPVNVWQQQIRVGLAGRLETIELRLLGPVDAFAELHVRLGDGWNMGPTVWSGSHTKLVEGYEILVLDLSEVNLLLDVGETFVLEAFGNDTGFEILGNYMHPLSGPPGYDEPLFLSGPGCYDNCGWRLGFKTFMNPDLADSYCVSIPNSTGAPAVLSTSGSFGVAANDLVLHGDDLPAGQPGMFFYGPGPNAALFGNGVLCVSPGVGGMARLPIAMVDGGGHLTTALDVTLPPTVTSQISAGSTWYFQAWYRDPAGGGAGINLTDGLEISFLP